MDCAGQQKKLDKPVFLDLIKALPGSVYFSDSPTFQDSSSSYWSVNACEAKPLCIVRPANSRQVATAVKILRSAYDACQQDPEQQIGFAVRSGGHSPEAGFSSLKDGIVIDMSLFSEIALSDDESLATFGVGNRWRDVYAKLGERGLSVVGGRNAGVGIGGLVLGGGISFFSPQFGMVCDNIERFEIVLADGTIALASATQYADLWRALRGGSGNFGIVTNVTARTFRTTNIWSGYLYWPSWQTIKVLKTFFEFNRPENFDPYAAAPILCLAYLQRFGIRVVASSIAYTKPQPWPNAFQGFKSIWRMWNTMKIQSISDATLELDGLAPPGHRQFQCTTTIKNDLHTILAINDLYAEILKGVKYVKGSIWSLVFQGLHTVPAESDNSNVLGLGKRHTEGTLIIILISVSWLDVAHDELVHQVSRGLVDSIEDLALQQGTADPFRYLNYAASLQTPFQGYGEQNIEFLRTISRKHDPTGFFQTAKQGGFKLDSA